MTNRTTIINAKVFDGNRFIGKKNVTLEDEKIISLDEQDISVHDANELVDATGYILSPGFIDVHTHADLSVVFADPLYSLSQGITTVIGGNCGISAGIHNGSALEGIINHDNWKHNEWTSWSEYWNWLSAQKLAFNYSSFIGYHTLIEESQKTGRSPLSILEEAIQHGYLGLSIGFDYGWGTQIDSITPLLDLLAFLSEKNAAVSVHLKDQGAHLTEAVAMFTDLFKNKETQNIRVQISHLKHKKYLDPNGEVTVQNTLQLIEKWRDAGFAISCDAYPYTGGATVLRESMVVQCQNGWDDIYPFGKEESIAEGAKKEGMTSSKYTKKLLSENSQQLAVYQNVMSEEEIELILSKDYCYIGSDGLPSHPRYTGTFPKMVKKAVKDISVLEATLGKMTALAAQYFNLKESHTIRVGESANIALFDPNTISDCATYSSPLQISQGIIAVWIQGRKAYSHTEGVLGKFGSLLTRQN